MKESKKYILALVMIHALVIAEVIFVRHINSITPMNRWVIFALGIVTYMIYLFFVFVVIFAMEDYAWSERKKITIIGYEVYLTDLLCLFPLLVMLVTFILSGIEVKKFFYEMVLTENMVFAAKMSWVGVASLLVSIITSVINIGRSKTKLAKGIGKMYLFLLALVIGVVCIMVALGWLEKVTRITDFY